MTYLSPNLSSSVLNTITAIHCLGKSNVTITITQSTTRVVTTAVSQ